MVVGPKTIVILEQYTDASDGIGGMTRTWAGKRFITGVLQALRGREYSKANKPTVVITHRLYIDTPIGITITEKDRIKYGTKTFDIQFINKQESQYELDLSETL